MDEQTTAGIGHNEPPAPYKILADDDGRPLVDVDSLDPEAIFLGDGVVDKIAEEIEAIVAKLGEPDMTVKADRDAVRSMAAQLARVRNAIDDEGKTYVAKLKDLPRKVDANRKKLRERLEDLQKRTRQPLTDLEEAEKRRAEQIEARIAGIKRQAADAALVNLQELDARMQALESVVLDEDTFGDRLSEAEVELLRAKEQVRQITDLKKLQAAEAVRQQQEREKAEAEAAEARREAAEARRKLEQEAAADRARRAAEEAAERQAAAAKAEEDRRAADAKHRGTVNTAALKALVEHAGLDEAQARSVVIAIVGGKIPAVVIRY